MNEPTNGNGNHDDLVEGLPDEYQQVVRYSTARQMKVAADLEAAKAEVASLRLQIADREVREKALQSLIAEMESRVNTMMAVRDEAVARSATLQSLHTSVLAMMRAHEIPNAPLINEPPAGVG
jgi:hypothetical protein